MEGVYNNLSQQSRNCFKFRTTRYRSNSLKSPVSSRTSQKLNMIYYQLITVRSTTTQTRCAIGTFQQKLPADPDSVDLRVVVEH